MENTNPTEQKSGPDSGQDSKVKSPVTEGLLIAGASAMAYLLAFAYERSYANFFDIPTQLIDVSLLNILVVVTIIVAFVLFIFPYLNFISILPNVVHPSIGIKLALFLMLVVITAIVPLLLLGFSSWDIMIGPLIGLASMAIIVFVFPLILHKGGLIQRYEAQIELDKPGTFFSLEDKLASSSPVFVFLSFLLLIAYFLATVFGRAEALNKSKFLVTNTMPEMVVIRIYGDKMICAPFVRDKKEVEQSFVLLKVSEDPKLTLNLEAVGPLKSVEIKSKVPSPTSPQELTPVDSPNAGASPQITATPISTPVPEQSKEH